MRCPAVQRSKPNASLRGWCPAAVAVAGSPRMRSRKPVRVYLTSLGFDVAVAWGRVRGIDIDARHSDGRYVVEAKAEVGKNGPQQVNYFLGMLGELVQRMDDAQASYGIVLPDNRQYRGLLDRLPALAKERLRHSVLGQPRW